MIPEKLHFIWMYGPARVYDARHRYALWTKEKSEYANAYGKATK